MKENGGISFIWITASGLAALIVLFILDRTLSSGLFVRVDGIFSAHMPQIDRAGIILGAQLGFSIMCAVAAATLAGALLGRHRLKGFAALAVSGFVMIATYYTFFIVNILYLTEKTGQAPAGLWPVPFIALALALAAALLLLKPRRAVIPGVSLALVIVYLLINRDETMVLRIINGISLAAVANLLLGCCCLIRNSGQFRLMGYSRYRKAVKELDEGAAPSFHEYNAQKYMSKWDSSRFFFTGLPLAVTAVILTVIFY